jgi:uncharacterized protein YodC (DUF2158 family)
MQRKVKAAKPPFRCGDVVQFTAGGPRMTVASVVPPDVHVLWFDSEDHLHSATLPARTLVLSTPQS